MDLISLVVIVAGLLLFSLVSGGFAGTVVTAPMLFIGFGFVFGSGFLGWAQLDPGHSAIHTLAELTLILVLFTDAARIDLSRVRRDHDLPLRMLGIGLPLAISIGAGFAFWWFPDLMLWEAALLAALLAPTDAALGQSVVANTVVPARIRQAINIESGLNDGLVLPLVLMFAALAAVQGAAHESLEAWQWLQFGLQQVALGLLVGAVVGYFGARLIDTAVERGWMETSSQGIGILSLAMFCFAAAEVIGGNGFIAAFVGGAVFGNSVRNSCTFLFEFMETEGQLLMLLTFMVFGAALLPEAISQITPQTVLYALLSLTVIRMLPVVISLLGAGLRLPTQLFLGWFGPRGLASILFVLLILEHADPPHAELLFTVTIVTVGLSALLHGLSAAPVAKLYGELALRMGDCEENRTAMELPLREGQPKPVEVKSTGR